MIDFVHGREFVAISVASPVLKTMSAAIDVLLFLFTVKIACQELPEFPNNPVLGMVKIVLPENLNFKVRPVDIAA